jgi:pimeloyl-ACP methyl ester carboxylesterase
VLSPTPCGPDLPGGTPDQESPGRANTAHVFRSTYPGSATRGVTLRLVVTEHSEAQRREDLTVITSDGVQLQCRRSSHPDGSPAVVVIVHGFASGRDNPDVCALADQLFAAGTDVVTYDARGHGLSEGCCGVGSTEHLDVASVLSSIAADAPIMVVGVSMGAVAVVSHLAGADAREKRITGAVLVSAPSRWRMRPSAVGLLTAVLTRSAVGRWAAARWLGVRIKRGWWPGETPESAIRRIRVPVVVVHGASGIVARPSLTRIRVCHESPPACRRHGPRTRLFGAESSARGGSVAVSCAGLDHQSDDNSGMPEVDRSSLGIFRRLFMTRPEPSPATRTSTGHGRIEAD